MKSFQSVQYPLVTPAQTGSSCSSPRRSTTLLLTLALCLGSFASAHAAGTKPWISVGPDGGDARALAPDPKNPQQIYLGTTSSWVYRSEDGGRNWMRLAKLGTSDDLVVDNLLVDESDSKTLIAGARTVDGHGGAVYISHDAGKTWSADGDMNGQHVLAIAQAPSDPKMYVAGTLAGVFRSMDGGQHWTQISPANSTEVHEVESIAIDPVNINTIYAGTWHLPWKTTDGGAHWSNIKQGVIDDSDVFSIIIDPHAPSVVYASACSGIYKSENSGDLFHKVQGIPSTARRTRVLMQDPRDQKIVYAGTTEGLYKTSDAGANWSRLTGPDVIVNDVYVDPSNNQHVLLATDRSGVLTSETGGTSFESANKGFSQRQVQSLLVDQAHPGTLWAGVLNDKIYGGAFVSRDNGASWQQQSDGLAGRDVFTLAQAQDGTVYAGTNDGLLKFVDGKWQADGDRVTMSSRKVTTRVHGRRVQRTVDKVEKNGAITGRVNMLDLGGSTWYAATSSGVYRTSNQGTTWEGPVLAAGDFGFVDAFGSRVVAGQRNSLMLSDDTGQNWKPVPMPAGLSGINALAVSADQTLWVGGREGVFYSKDSGANWEPIKNLPIGVVGGLNYDASLKRVLVTSPNSTLIFGVDATGTPWKWWDAGWRVHQVLRQGNRLAAASYFNGVVLEPEAAQVDEHVSTTAQAPASAPPTHVPAQP